ncbi:MULTISPECIES: IclR family transcriptional regulator [Malaciobacter]|uniref:IclR family transcriptional regulator n=2 Tax=Malaciobacter TaxID=2321114 RepID=A0AB36ZT97_9BACT|nr:MULTISPECIES: IclR family transcriptional regulator [Malaciobacter]PHO08622.1 IclR family transcriptional regulator [Malaciobacter canalis]PPK58075.1 IclR family transcriptional regulator [Malaciobacter marinus]QEE32813.1 transcriptional regulator, IclR family [Malaciobacter canalis]SKB76809.1 transcriptional regulator, IclR family [Malaciobacter marinus]
MQKQNKSLSKGLMVLKQIMASTKPLTANILCQKLQIDKSTMSRLITTLMNEDFIEYKSSTKEIILSDILKKIIHKDDREKIVEKTSGLLDEIFYLTEECSYIGIFDNNSVLYLNQVDKSKRVLKTRNSVGLHAPIHTNGFGKAILAFKEDINLETIELKKFTSNTITSITKLKKEIELIKERGYAIGNEEHEFGLCSVAVPYFNKKGEFVGTVGVSGLTVRMDEQKLHEYGQKIFKLVNPYV